MTQANQSPNQPDGQDQTQQFPPDQQPVPGPPQGPPPPSGGSDKDERMWAMFCHLAAFAGAIGIGWGHIIGPLVVWLIKKDEYPLVDVNGKKSLNFQISVTIYGIICVPFILLFFIGFLMLIALSIFTLVMVIIAAVKTNNGEDFEYPLSIQFLK